MTWWPSGSYRGQNVVEYGVLLATIALVVLVGIMTFGSLIQPWFISLSQRITTLT
jgi:Flp pilus assembly pilin Flp